MRILITTTVILLFLASCNDTEFDEVDFIAYTYRQFDSDDPKYAREWRIICPFYLHIDRQYSAYLIKGVTFSDSSIKFFEQKNDPELKAIIKEVIDQSKEFGSETDFRPPINQLRLYDGSSLKIRIIDGKTRKIIHFWENQVSSQSFEKLLSYANKLYQKGNHSYMNPDIYEKRQKFIKFVVGSDSVLRPLPPLAPRDIKPEYIPPKVIE